MFAGGNSYRDYDLLVKAVEGLDVPVRVASSWRPSQPLPANVQVASLPQDEYNRTMLGAGLMVVPLRPAARSAGQQTYLSAMLAGKPLIVTDAPGVRDYVVPGQTALVVEPDPEALRAAITWVLDPANKAEVRADDREGAPDGRRAVPGPPLLRPVVGDRHPGGGHARGRAQAAAEQSPRPPRRPPASTVIGD